MYQYEQTQRCQSRQYPQGVLDQTMSVLQQPQTSFYPGRVPRQLVPNNQDMHQLPSERLGQGSLDQYIPIVHPLQGSFYPGRVPRQHAPHSQQVYGLPPSYPNHCQNPVMGPAQNDATAPFSRKYRRILPRPYQQIHYKRHMEAEIG
jgi:hypothetical protein